MSFMGAGRPGRVRSPIPISWPWARGGSLEDAFKSATADIGGWIAEDYKLTPLKPPMRWTRRLSFRLKHLGASKASQNL